MACEAKCIKKMKKKHYCIFWTVSVLTYVVIIIQGFRSYNGQTHPSSESGPHHHRWYSVPERQTIAEKEQVTTHFNTENVNPKIDGIGEVTTNVNTESFHPKIDSFAEKKQVITELNSEHLLQKTEGIVDKKQIMDVNTEQVQPVVSGIVPKAQVTTDYNTKPIQVKIGDDETKPSVANAQVPTDYNTQPIQPKIDANETIQIRPKIAILIPVMIEDLAGNTTPRELFDKCLSSISATLESQYDYTFFIGFNSSSYKSQYGEFFKNTGVLSHLIVVEKGSTLVEIINDIARYAYDNGMQYFVRTSLRTTFLTLNWTSEAIKVLLSNEPSNLGVVGPTCIHDNRERLCIDMVHRTHLDIFFEYYPIEFTRNWIEDWITDVYKPNNSKELPSWRVSQENPNARDIEIDKTKERLLLLETLDKVHMKYFVNPLPVLPNAISYCLYGDKQRYLEGAKANLKLLSAIYPGWQLWIYYHKSVPTSILHYLRQYKFVTLIDMTSTKWANRMSWRFLIASNSSIERYLIRDIDSRLSLREKAAVDEWMVSGKQFHIMRDHPFHTAYPMSGGMWGAVHEAIPQMDQLLHAKMIDDQYMRDMYFLHNVIYPIAQKSVLQHDSFSCGLYKAKPFPRPRKNHMDYVGSVLIDGVPFMTAKDHKVMATINEPSTCHYNPFKIIVITQTDYQSLYRLLQTIQAAEYDGHPVHLDIRIVSMDTADNKRTIYTAAAFEFTHGTKTLYLDCCHLNMSDTAWYKAWKPRANNERAVILPDIVELSPFWFQWMSAAWHEYGSRDDLAAISLDKLRLNESSSANMTSGPGSGYDKPFLYRFITQTGLSPNIQHWIQFTKWAKQATLDYTNMPIPANVSTELWNKLTYNWQRAWLTWLDKNLYTLYVHPKRGVLIREQTPIKDASDNHADDNLLTKFEPILETFPQQLEHFKMDSDVGSIAEIPVAHKSIVVWSNDLHISPIANIKSLLIPMNVTFIDKSLSGHCPLTNTCATDIKVLRSRNAMTPSEITRKRFRDAYMHDAEFGSVDIVMCFHPSAMCELFMPFDKRLFVIATTRYEIGRWKPPAWKRWNKNLQTIYNDPKNVVGANNVYDAEYMQYFTGIKPILLPSVVVMREKYTPVSADILVAAMHSQNSTMIWPILRNISSRFKDLKKKYKRYSYQQLCENTAILHIPYQVSVMSLFEQYAMGIPIIAPSAGFLWKLHNHYDLVTERTWGRILNYKRPGHSTISGFHENTNIPDPNNDLDEEAFMYWVKYSDYYLLEHIVTFDSWEELGTVILDTDWTAVSRKMRAVHDIQVRKAKSKWDCLIHHTDWRSCYNSVS